MRSLTSVDLAFSWPEAPKHLPRRWVAVLDPYVDQEQSSIVSARLTFHSTDPVLEDFLAFAEQEKAREPGTGGFLGRLGLRGQSIPQGTTHVLAPPTPLQVRDRCPACDRPLTVALSTNPSDDWFGRDRSTVTNKRHC